MFDRFLNVFRHRRIEDEVRQEIETHLASIEDAERARGVHPQEARRKARIRFGNPTLYSDQTRDANLAIWIDDLRRDLKFAFRQLAGNPAFSAVVVLVLALGIGANTTLFSIVHSVLMRPLAYPEADRLVRVWSAMPARGFAQADSSFPDYRAMRGQNRTLVDLGAYVPARYNLSVDNRSERVSATWTTASLLRVLGVQPLIGNLYAESAEQWGEHRVVLLGEDLWRRRFGADRSVVGRTVTLDEEPYLVVGVMPSTFHFPDPQSQLWTPIAFPPQSDMYTRGNYFLQMVGRLRPGLVPAQALADLTAVAHGANPDISAAVQTLQETVVGDVRPTLLLLLGAVTFVLLIVCVNVANLILARATTRHKELTVRLALGATAGRIMRQLLTESAVLAAVGGGCGLLLAFGALRLLKIWVPAGIPRLNEVTLNPAALGFAAGVALLTGFAFGILPAWQAAGNRAAGGTLKESSRGTSSGRLAVWTRNTLVIAEAALSLMLLIGAGLFIMSLMRLLQVDPGFKRENLLTLHLDLPQLRYREPVRTVSFVNQAVERINALPGVVTTGVTTALPLGEGSWGRLLTVEGQPPPRSFAEIPVIQYRQVTPDYFRALGVRLKHGRFFSAEDRREAPGVAIINETLARRLLANAEPGASSCIWDRTKLFAGLREDFHVSPLLES